MKQFLTLAAVFGALTTAALAAPQKADNAAAKGMAKSAAPKCPHCNMALKTKADKTHTAAVKINGKTYYCCPGCGMHKNGKASAKSVVPKCPHCKMTLTTKKDKTHTAAVKINGKTYYCCAGCGMDKSAKKDAKATAKAAKKAAKAAKKAAKAPMCPKCNMQMSFTKSPLKNTAMKVNGTTYYCCTICPKH